MSNHRIWGGSVRKLWPTEMEKFRDHLLRLDKESRRMRFAHGVSDSFIRGYASRMIDLGSVIYGFFDGGVLRAAAELRKLGSTWGQEAEAALSVEEPWQNQGIGTALMGRLIGAARNRGVQRLYMSCLAENGKIQAIARKHAADLSFEYGEVVGEIVPLWPDYFTYLTEAVDDRVGFMMAVLDVQNRSAAAA